MPTWTFIQRDWPSLVSERRAHPDNFARHQIQALSDMYKVFQSRLDSYRQSAGAIFLGVLAAVFGFDSGFMHFLTDSGAPRPARPNGFLFDAVLVAAFAVFLISIAGFQFIRNFANYFAEMTSIIYKIDKNNRVWDEGIWLNGEFLFPNNFRSERNVSVDRRKDPVLIGWRDLAIDGFKWMTLGVAFLQFGFLVCLFLHIRRTAM